MAPPDTSTCVASGCRSNDHLTTCDTATCRGCKPNPREHGQLCNRCAARLADQIAELPDLYAEVVDPPTAADNNHDPISRHLPAGVVPAPSRQPRVSGNPDEILAAAFVEAGPGSTRVAAELRQARRDAVTILADTLPTLGRTEAAAAIRTTAVALLDPARRDDLAPQIGDYLPPAVMLAEWVDYWRRMRRESMPQRTVDVLCRWLGDRLDWAVVHDPEVGEFGAEIGATVRRLWVEAGRTEPRPELCRGVRCRCGQQTLYRRTDGSGDVDCHNADCGAVWRADEYERWVRALADVARRGQTPVAGG